MMVSELSKMPTSKDCRWEMKDYQSDLAGLSAWGITQAFKAIRRARFGQFMPTPQEVVIAYNEVMEPVISSIEHRKGMEKLRRENAEALAHSQKVLERSQTPRDPNSVARVKQIYDDYMRRYEAEKAKDIESRIRQQQDDAKLFLSKSEFEAMQRQSPDIHRCDSPIAGAHLTAALERKKQRGEAS